MDSTMTAVEVRGNVDEQRRLHVDELLPITGPRRVRVIVLFSDEEDFDEAEWLRAAAANPAFDFLKNTAEDIYSVTDGVSFRDEA